MIPLGVLGASRTVEAGGAWLPTDLGGSLAAWYDAADPATLTIGGGNLTAWGDKSSNARHLSAITTNTWITGSTTLNGLNVVVPNNARPFTASGSLTLPQPYTVAVVAKAAATSAYIVSVALAEGNCYGVSVFNTGPVWRIRNGTNLDGGTPDTDPHVLVGVHNGNSSLIRVDGTQVAAGAAGSTNPSKIIVGGAVTSSGSAMWNGYLAEIIIAGGALTGSDLTNLETYLADKWGL